MTTKTAAPATTHLTCRKCYRPITSLRSIREALTNGGYGRGCARKVAENAKAAAMTESPAQVAKAVDLIEDEALVPVRRGVYQAVSTDGTEVYLTAATTCTCPARKRCYHSIAVEILTARPVEPARVFALPGAPVAAPVVTFPTDPADELEALFAADKAAHLARQAA